MDSSRIEIIDVESRITMFGFECMVVYGGWAEWVLGMSMRPELRPEEHGRMEGQVQQQSVLPSVSQSASIGKLRAAVQRSLFGRRKPFLAVSGRESHIPPYHKIRYQDTEFE